MSQYEVAAKFTITQGGNKNGNAVVMGVNPVGRIVYLGDAYLFTDKVNYNPNSITWNNRNMLMCNLWAWIVAQLVYGDDTYAADYR